MLAFVFKSTYEPFFGINIYLYVYIEGQAKVNIFIIIQQPYYSCTQKIKKKLTLI